MEVLPLKKVHEANVAAEAYRMLTELGYSVLLQYECMTYDGKQCYLDMVLIIDNHVELIVEFKNLINYPHQSGQLSKIVSDPQLIKYLSLGPPVYLCNGFESILELVEFILLNYPINGPQN